MKTKNSNSKIYPVGRISIGDSITAFIPSEHKIPFVRGLRGMNNSRREQNSHEDIRKAENIKRVRELADKLFKS